MPEAETTPAVEVDQDELFEDALFSPPATIIPNTIGAYLLRVTDHDQLGIVSERLPIIGWECAGDPLLLGMPLTICQPAGASIEFIGYDRCLWNDDCGVLHDWAEAVEYARTALELIRAAREQATEAAAATQH